MATAAAKGTCGNRFRVVSAAAALAVMQSCTVTTGQCVCHSLMLVGNLQHLAAACCDMHSSALCSWRTGSKCNQKQQCRGTYSDQQFYKSTATQPTQQPVNCDPTNDAQGACWAQAPLFMNSTASLRPNQTELRLQLRLLLSRAAGVALSVASAHLTAWVPSVACSLRRPWGSSYTPTGTTMSCWLCRPCSE